MRWNTFGRSATFAAVAAGGWVPWALVVGAILGVWNAGALYLIGLVTCYVAGLCPQGTRRMAAVTGLAALALACAAGSIIELCIGLAVLLGIARSGFLYRTAPACAVLTEAVLLVGGLLFARFLGGPSLASTTLAIWGFLLVQSVFFLVAGGRARKVGARHGDGFEEVYRLATTLLDRTGV